MEKQLRKIYNQYYKSTLLISGLIRITSRKQLLTVSLKQAKLFEEHSDEFFACGVGKDVFSDSYTALIFCFFCIKTKENGKTAPQDIPSCAYSLRIFYPSFINTIYKAPTELNKMVMASHFYQYPTPLGHPNPDVQLRRICNPLPNHKEFIILLNKIN
ncbi:MAG: hypothetical protein WCL14_12175 [Bacteroidota bacterium]